MNAADAVKLLGQLKEPLVAPARSWGERFLEYARTERRGPPEAQAVALRELYGAPRPDRSMLQLIDRLEAVLLPVLAQATMQPVGALKATLHRGKAAFAGEAPFREEAEAPLPAPPPSPAADWNPEGAFRVFGGSLVLGEAPDADDAERRCLIVRPAMNGAWFVWSVPGERPGEDGEVLDATRWVAVHESAVARAVKLAASAPELGEVWVHGGATSAVDAEVRRDRAFLQAFEYGEPTGRSFTVGLGGDGTASWRGVEADGRLLLVSTLSDL